MFLDALLNKYRYYESVFEKVPQKVEELKCLLTYYCNDLNIYLSSIGLEHDFFSVQWIITIFSNSVKKPCLYQIWDLFLIFGWKFMDFFIVSLLIFYKDEITDYNHNDNLLCKIKDLLKHESFSSNFSIIVNNAFFYLKDFEMTEKVNKKKFDYNV